MAYILYMLSVWSVYFLLSYFLFKWAKMMVTRATEKFAEKKISNEFLNLLIKNKVYSLVSYYVPFLILRVSTDVLFPSSSKLLKVLNLVYSIIGVVLFSMILFRLLNTFTDLYASKGLNKSRPIKGMVQFIQVIIVFFTSIACISIVFEISFPIILGSLGAASAILMLIFKDTISGLVAGIQITFNNMVKIGDWVSIDKYNVDGEVIEINLASVKIQNWDKSISTIPAYSFVNSDSIRNWQGMIDSESRRIIILINVDINSVRPYTVEVNKKFKNHPLLRDFISESSPCDTNLGMFRTYLSYYLNKIVEINTKESVIVRLQEITKDGLILQIYCFSNITSSFYFAELQSRILEHVIFVAPIFDLVLYQSTTGKDIEKRA